MSNARAEVRRLNEDRGSQRMHNRQAAGGRTFQALDETLLKGFCAACAPVAVVSR